LPWIRLSRHVAWLGDPVASSDLPGWNGAGATAAGPSAGAVLDLAGARTRRPGLFAMGTEGASPLWIRPGRSGPHYSLGRDDIRVCAPGHRLYRNLSRCAAGDGAGAGPAHRPRSRRFRRRAALHGLADHDDDAPRAGDTEPGRDRCADGI